MRIRLALAAGVLLSLALMAFLWGAEGSSAPRDEQVEKLIEQLGAEDYQQRESANQVLDTMGDRPLALLREAARDSKNPEIRWRAIRLLSLFWKIRVRSIRAAPPAGHRKQTSC